MAGIASGLESRLPAALAPAEAGAPAGKGLVSLFDATLSRLMPVVPPDDQIIAQVQVAASSLPAAPEPAAMSALTAPEVCAASPMSSPTPLSASVVREHAGSAAPEQTPDTPATLKARMTAALSAGPLRATPAPAEASGSDTEVDAMVADAATTSSLPMVAQMPVPASLPTPAPAQLPATDVRPLTTSRAAPAPAIAPADQRSVTAASPRARVPVVAGTPAASASPLTPDPAAMSAAGPSFTRELASAVAAVTPRTAEKPAATAVVAAAADASAQIVPNQTAAELPRPAANASHPPVALAHTPLQDPAWAQAAGQRLAWMVQGGESTAVLAINPESLGPIHVRIHMDGQNARIDLAAQQPMTATLMESHLPRLTAALESQGVRVDELRVGSQALAGDFTAGQGASAGSGQQAAAGEQGARQSRWMATAASLDSSRTPLADLPAAVAKQRAGNDGRVDDFA